MTTATEDAPTVPAERILPTAPWEAVPALSLPLNQAWRFSIDPQANGEDRGWADPGFDDSGWTIVDVPHTWNVMPDHSDYEGSGWYRRTFRLPDEVQNAHLRLRFEAVFYLADVWLNGMYLGSHEGGYTSFEFDISSVVEPTGENVIAVRVDNRRTTHRIPAVLRSDWSFDWYNWGGIVRPVALEATSLAYIADQRLVAIPHLTGVDTADYATVTATITIHNQSDQPLMGNLSGQVFDEDSVEALPDGMVSQPVRVAPGQSSEIQLEVTLVEPVLWHFDRPHLYRWMAQLESAEGVEQHAADETFGVRLIELKGASFYLNGEMMRLVGLTRHADSPEHGLAETVQVMARDWDDLKRLNMVFSRPVHYPQADYILDYADRNGVLLIPEIPAWQLTAKQMSDPRMIELGKQQLAEMIAASYNHPSIWAWSVGNEFDSDTNQGREWVRTMMSLAKSLDPYRPVGFASNRLNRVFMLGKEATSQADFVMMNQYFGTWAGPKQGLSAALDRIHSTWPEKPVIISEFGFEPSWYQLSGLSISEIDPEAYYFIPEGEDPAGEEADAQRRLLIREQLELFRSKPFVAAVVFWTYQDYRTRADFLMGVVDFDRNRRGSWAVLREEFSPIVFESLTFSPPKLDRRTARVSLRARGPLETDLPAYILRAYRLVWQVASPDGGEIFFQEEIQLPDLAPAATWEGELAWELPKQEYVLRISILRPTGFSLLERTYNAEGIEIGD